MIATCSPVGVVKPRPGFEETTPKEDFNSSFTAIDIVLFALL